MEYGNYGQNFYRMEVFTWVFFHQRNYVRVYFVDWEAEVSDSDLTTEDAIWKF